MNFDIHAADGKESNTASHDMAFDSRLSAKIKFI